MCYWLLVLSRHFNNCTTFWSEEPKCHSFLLLSVFLLRVSLLNLRKYNITHKELWKKITWVSRERGENCGHQKCPGFHYFPAAETSLGRKKPPLAPKLFNNTTFSGKNNLCVCSQVLALQIIHEHRFYWFTLVFSLSHNTLLEERCFSGHSQIV